MVTYGRRHKVVMVMLIVMMLVSLGLTVSVYAMPESFLKLSQGRNQIDFIVCDCPGYTCGPPLHKLLKICCSCTPECMNCGTVCVNYCAD
jgi:hypothetical protein